MSNDTRYLVQWSTLHFKVIVWSFLLPGNVHMDQVRVRVGAKVRVTVYGNCTNHTRDKIITDGVVVFVGENVG